MTAAAAVLGTLLGGGSVVHVLVLAFRTKLAGNEVLGTHQCGGGGGDSLGDVGACGVLRYMDRS